ncbi:MAG TPA: tetratricopeptide repeat protein [Bacteroidetes bacterium]|nr:tetratricopeptide repeat protein [Bacteroidota bacterium]
MNEKRLGQLKALLSSDPKDPFLVYAIAQEYLSCGNLKAAKGYFARLMTEHPSYIPTYYHYGLTLYQLGESETAIEVWKKGVFVAEEAGDWKTSAEILEFLDDLEEDSEAIVNGRG